MIYYIYVYINIPLNIQFFLLNYKKIEIFIINYLHYIYYLKANMLIHKGNKNFYELFCEMVKPDFIIMTDKFPILCHKSVLSKWTWMKKNIDDEWYDLETKSLEMKDNDHDSLFKVVKYFYNSHVEFDNNESLMKCLMIVERYDINDLKIILLNLIDKDKVSENFHDYLIKICKSDYEKNILNIIKEIINYNKKEVIYIMSKLNEDEITKELSKYEVDKFENKWILYPGILIGNYIKFILMPLNIARNRYKKNIANVCHVNDKYPNIFYPADEHSVKLMMDLRRKKNWKI